MTIQQAASELVSEFARQLQLGLTSPASFVEYYNDDDDALRLEIKFYEYGGGADPFSPAYELCVEDFNFYKLNNSRWEWVDPNYLGITNEDFIC
jgi:hypothetical protein